MEPIHDKAEVSIDFPDKFYMGSFSRESSFGAVSENDGLFLKLERQGEEKRVVGIHLHHFLLADILSEWSRSLKAQKTMDKDHKKDLMRALKRVEAALARL